MKKYCAFWIPSINHCVPRLIGGVSTGEIDASDDYSDDKKHPISVEVKLKENAKS
jgi:hypothetical protein